MEMGQDIGRCGIKRCLGCWVLKDKPREQGIPQILDQQKTLREILREDAGGGKAKPVQVVCNRDEILGIIALSRRRVH